MKFKTKYLVILFIATSLFSSFTSKAQETTDKKLSEFELVVQHLESNGNFINTMAPALILADEIKEN